MGLRPTQGDEKRLGPATTPYRTLPSPCHPACPGVPWDRDEAERRDLRFRGPFLEMFLRPSEEICSCPRNHRSFTQTKAKETQRNRRSLRPRAHGAGNSSRSRPGSLLSGAHIAKGAITGCGKTQFCIRARLYRLRKNSLRTTGKVGTGFSPCLNTGKSFGL
jgi:hypothetical protein